MSLTANMKVRSLPVLMLSLGFLMGSCGENKRETENEDTQTTQEAAAAEASTEAGPNELSEKEKEEGWELLFDGETTEGWRGYLKDEFPSQGWTIEDGALKVIGSGAGEAGGG